MSRARRKEALKKGDFLALLPSLNSKKYACSAGLTVKFKEKISLSSLMYQSNRSLNIPPPPGEQPPGHLHFWKIFVQIPHPEAEKLFKFPIVGPIQVIKYPNPMETFQ